jgi:HAD superfamily hydrolase (TIGR01509 family)
MIAAPLRALIFDFDGLLVNTEPIYWQVARELVAARGKPPVSQQTLNSMMGIGRLHSMRILIEAAGLDETPEELVVERERRMRELYSGGQIDPMPGAREILRRFHGKLKLAIATNSAMNLIEIILPRLGIEGYFDVVQTGDDIANGKPDPEIYLKAMARLQVAAGSCVVMEDTQPGCIAANRAGARVIAVPNELTQSQDFSMADARVTGLTQAMDVIELMDART